MSPEGPARPPTVRRDLPVFLTSFVGRERDLEVLTDLLSGHRLVTLTGPGGIGKTRLALQLVERSRPDTSDVGFVDYSGTDEAASALGEIASSLGLAPIPGGSLEERLFQHISTHRLLLVLDNCEQLLDPVRRLATLLLERCPELRILATSRERLGVPCEVTYPVPPLSTPPNDGETRDDVTTYEAAKLFVQRAVPNQPDFRIGPDNAQVIARICSRLDGIPLALELAAARLRMMSLLDLDEGLGDRFRLLTGGASGRQESLWTTIDWSYRLLQPQERHAFHRLSVFAGGFRFEAAEAVAGGDRNLVEAVGHLVDKSFLQLGTDADGRTRYRMLHSIRAYGLAKLRHCGEIDQIHLQHVQHYLDVAQEAARHAEGAGRTRWLDRLEADHDNLLLAIAWSHRKARGAFVQLVTALGWYWQQRGDPSEGQRWLEVALTEYQPDECATLGLLRWATTLAEYVRDMPTATHWARRSLELAQRCHDRLNTAHARLALGNILSNHDLRDRRTQAKKHYEDAYRLYREEGELRRCVYVLLNLSMMNMALGSLAEARRQAMEAMEIAGAGGWRDLIWSALIRVGLVAFRDGRDQEAERLFEECLRLEPAERHPMSRTNGLYICVLALAAIAARCGKSEYAARLSGGADAVAGRDEVPTLLPVELVRTFDHWQEMARQAMPPSSYRALVDSGRELSDAQIRELALASIRTLAGPATVPLSRRELQIVELVADGLTNRQVASRLGVSPRTVDSHIDHVRNKLGLRTRAQIVRWLIEFNRVHEAEVEQDAG